MMKTVIAVSLLAAGLSGSLWAAESGALKTFVVTSAGAVNAEMQSFDAVVEPVRQTALAAQVPGAIVSLHVKVGDQVKAGQELLRIDARSANQNAAASHSQVEAARASLNVAAKDFERQKQLFQKQYISQAALDRSQAQFQATQAQVQALQSQSDAAQTQSRFFVVQAPYSGVVSEVAVTLGDMAMPGKTLLVMHDPAAMRITASIAQSAIPANLGKVQFEIPSSHSMPIRMDAATSAVLPVIDASTHTAQIRVNIPASVKGLIPGMFARVWIAADKTTQSEGKAQRLYVPTQVVVKRAELMAVYVVDEKGNAKLRQVRLGNTVGEQVEVLSGLRAGDKVATDPQAAAKVR
jgi:RND family efflux transporter MFP subunit